MKYKIVVKIFKDQKSQRDAVESDIKKYKCTGSTIGNCYSYISTESASILYLLSSNLDYLRGYVIDLVEIYDEELPISCIKEQLYPALITTNGVLSINCNYKFIDELKTLYGNKDEVSTSNL